MNKLRVWWIPQVPGEPFTVPVKTLREGKLVLDILANYDAFQFDHRIKPDYCNAGGLQEFDLTDDHDGSDGSWSDWYDPEEGREVNNLTTEECEELDRKAVRASAPPYRP